MRFNDGEAERLRAEMDARPKRRPQDSQIASIEGAGTPIVTASGGATVVSLHPNEGAARLDEVHEFLGRFIAYPSRETHIAHTLWVAHTHFMDAWDTTPRIAFLSPEPASGKTRALEISETLVPRPVLAVNMSSSSLFRKVSDKDGRPTILFDEVDAIFGVKASGDEDLRALLNAGYRKGAVTCRSVVRGKEVFVEDFPAYAALALAGLGFLPDTVMTRSIVVAMRRRAPTERVESFRRRIHVPIGEAIRERLSEWAAQTLPLIRWPDLPQGIEDRAADIWEPLIAVAVAAGGDWPELARVSCVSLVSQVAEGQESLGIRLLRDIRTVFGEAEAIHTDLLVQGLIEIDESPWGDMKGKPIDSRGLARRVKPYGVAPKQVRVGEVSKKGYERASFFDAWARYLSPSVEKRETGETTETDNDLLDRIDREEAEAIRQDRE